jgi:ATP-binding cassette subfamily B protein
MSPRISDAPVLTLEQEERASGLRTLRKVSPYIWPADKQWVKRRVVWSMLALILSKVVAIGTSFLAGGAVDVLSGDLASVFTLGALGLVVAYGLARLLNVGFQQLRDAIFAPVAQRALRALALETFEHIHQLSMRYHITRKTGGLSRIVERGVKGVEFLLRFLLFSIGPLVLELLMVAVAFSWYFDFRYLAILTVTIAVYIWFTFKVTEWRVKLRRVMNA